MASGVNIKMGVSGIAQFKQGMKESQAAVKSLEAALKLNEAAMKNSANQEQYLENKTALLTRQLEAQKDVVHQTEQALQAMQRNGVDKTSTAFQNMQAQLYKAQTDFVNIKNELEGVGDAGEDAQEGVSHMNQSLQRIGANVSVDNVVNGISKVTDGLEAAAKKAVELGRKLVQAMLTGGQWADDLQTTATKWEMTPEQVYRMQQTANLIDTSAETIFQARKKITTAMGKEKDKETMGAFAALGITNLSGSEANIENVFWKAGEGLMQMEDQVARNEYAMKLYGKSWEELIPLFKTGREEYEATMESWTWVGDQQFEALTQLDDESKKTQSAWDNIMHTLEAAMAPAMTEILQSLQGMMAEFNEYLQSEEGQEMLTKLGEAVSNLFSGFTELDPEEVIGKITGIFEKIKEGLEWFIQHKGEVYDALKVIAGGFALLKVTELASNIGRIVIGLKGLFPGGGGTDSGTGGNGTAAAAPTGNNTGTVFFDTVMSQINATTALARQDAMLKDWWKAGGGDVEQWAKVGVESGYLTEEQAQQNIEFKQKMDEFAETVNKNTQEVQKQNETAAANGSLDWRPSYMKGIESTDRMTQVAGEMGQAVDNSTQASSDMTDAAKNLMTLPEELNTTVYNAIMAGMKAVTIVVDAGCVDTIGQRVGGAMGLGLIDLVR